MFIYIHILFYLLNVSIQYVTTEENELWKRHFEQFENTKGIIRNLKSRDRQ